MKHLSDVLYETLSGEKAKETTTDICNYYRSFGSAGYHTATNLVVNKLQEIAGEIKGNAVMPLHKRGSAPQATNRKNK